MFIYTFNKDIKEQLLSHGAKSMKEITDINGKRLWCISAPESFTFDIHSLPKDQVIIKDFMRMDF